MGKRPEQIPHQRKYKLANKHIKRCSTFYVSMDLIFACPQNWCGNSNPQCDSIRRGTFGQWGYSPHELN